MFFYSADLDPAMDETEGSAAELQWLIEDRRRRIEDVEERLSSEEDEGLRHALEAMLRTLREEVDRFTEELESRDDAEDFGSEMEDIDSKIRDINSCLETETDPVVRNNLEVSKRFLQMERNGLLIRMTQKEKRKDPVQEKLEELEELAESRLRMIDDLRSRLEKAEKDLSYYKSVAEHPERNVSSDRTRVTLTAEALSELRNESKVLSVENYNLKTQVKELKREIDRRSADIKELTRHCRESDSEILRLQARVQELRMKLEEK